MDDVPTFTINGVTYDIDDSVAADDRLVNYIHDLQLVGTHITCFEGACGACIVTAAIPDPVSGKKTSYAVNSCLVPVASCAGWDITTVEGLGNSEDGYHVIQERLAEHYGTQCGYCSPGFVMSMYGLTQNNPSWTGSDVEKVLDSNICRCTGYRPIVDAFKSITPEEIKESQPKGCKGANGGCCKGACGSSKRKVAEKKCKEGKRTATPGYYQPGTLQELYSVLDGLPKGDSYSLICGNTGQAVVGADYSSKATIFVRNVQELAQVTKSADSLVLGATVTINHAIDEMSSMASTEGFEYLGEVAKYWENIASHSVRNLGCWAGNLVMRMYHNDFQSDLFPSLVAAGASVTLAATDGTTSTELVEKLLGMDIVADRKIIKDLTFPKMESDTVFRLFRVVPRFTNSHAFVNGGIRMQVDAAKNHTVTGTPVIIYGCISSDFVHAAETEKALADKSLEDDTVLQAALTSLAGEIKPDESPVEPDPAFKVAIAQNLLYKTILGIIGDVASADLISGGTDLVRPEQSSKQTFDENKEFWPLSEPIPKLESNIQCAGEAEYTVLAPARPDELFGLFVTSTQANAKITSIDATDALKIPGVVAFVGVDDIKGKNNIHNQSIPAAGTEQLFPDDRVSYYGQPLGLVVCEGRGPAYAAAAAVKVTYGDIKPPVLSIDDGEVTSQTPVVKGDVDAGFAASTTTVQGTMTHDAQYHFAMESQVCIATPTDEGLDIVAGTQWSSETQRVIAQVLGIPDNKVNVTTKRVGGAFGSKIERCNIIATAAALAAKKTRKSVRVSLDFDVNTTLTGWREPYKCTYKAGVNDEGLLQAIEATITSNSGYFPSTVTSGMAADALQSCYNCPNLKATPQYAITNVASNTAMRAPGTTEGMSLMENIMDHLASAIKMDPLEFRRKNLMADGDSRPAALLARHRLRGLMAGKGESEVPKEVVIEKNLINDMLDQIMKSADIDTRKTAIKTFNQDNKWKKKGLAVMTQMFPYAPPPITPYNVMVSINTGDGTVAISHGGVEMGQGINTKVAQCAAYELGIPLDMIAIRPTNTHTNANSIVTAGSLGSNSTAYNVSVACRNLKTRLDNFKKTLDNPDVKWSELILLAFAAGVDICERYSCQPHDVKGYGVFGVAASEVELDVLTGEYMVTRTDILEDAGRSLSPLVDMGQIEGGFILGQGLFTSERPIFDPKTGENLTNTTWLYKVPYAREIPADFRVTILQNSPNPSGVHSSKVTGEPPVMLSYSVAMALREAINSAREDAGNTEWFDMALPMTVESVQKLCLVDQKRLVLIDA